MNPARITGSRHDANHPNGCEATLGHLTPLELEQVEAMATGQNWLRVDDSGRLASVDRFAELPKPVDDLQMTPFWSGDRDHDHNGNVSIGRFRNVIERSDDPNAWESPSITIQHVCAGKVCPSYEKDRDRYFRREYMKAAEALESWGFECCRSMRGKNGKFWELWFLPGLWYAKGELKKAIGDNRGRSATDAAISFFVRCQVSFGTLDVSVQRVALTFD